MFETKISIIKNTSEQLYYVMKQHPGVKKQELKKFEAATEKCKKYSRHFDSILRKLSLRECLFKKVTSKKLAALIKMNSFKSILGRPCP